MRVKFRFSNKIQNFAVKNKKRLFFSFYLKLKRFKLTNYTFEIV